MIVRSLIKLLWGAGGSRPREGETELGLQTEAGHPIRWGPEFPREELARTARAP